MCAQSLKVGAGESTTKIKRFETHSMHARLGCIPIFLDAVVTTKRRNCWWLKQGSRPNYGGGGHAARSQSVGHTEYPHVAPLLNIYAYLRVLRAVTCHGDLSRRDFARPCSLFLDHLVSCPLQHVDRVENFLRLVILSCLLLPKMRTTLWTGP